MPSGWGVVFRYPMRDMCDLEQMQERESGQGRRPPGFSPGDTIPPCPTFPISLFLIRFGVPVRRGAPAQLAVPMASQPLGVEGHPKCHPALAPLTPSSPGLLPSCGGPPRKVLGGCAHPPQSCSSESELCGGRVLWPGQCHPRAPWAASRGWNDGPRRPRARDTQPGIVGWPRRSFRKPRPLSPVGLSASPAQVALVLRQGHWGFQVSE